jgi:ABC-type glycerol-3-phosphate transport system permease component
VNTRPIARIFLWAALAFFSLATLVPFAWMMCASLKTQQDFVSSVFLPRGDGFLGVAWDRLTTRNFFTLFSVLPAGRALLNSIFFASVTSSLATFCCAAGGYALAKFEFPGRGFVTSFILGTVVLPVALLLGPGFETVFRLGLLNTYAGVILPAAAPAFGLYLFRQAMLNSVPNELIESARIEGCGEVRIFLQIVLPLVRPMANAFLLIMFIATWNNFIAPQIILQTPERFPLSVTIYTLRGLYGSDYGLIMAGTLVAVAPLMCLFLLLQREFIAGLTSGAVKG